jgi:hypothetical protein
MHHSHRAPHLLPLSIALTATIVAGCGPSDATLPAVSVYDSAGVTVVYNDLGRLHAVCELSDEPTVRIGTQEGPEEYQLYRVFGARRLSDGRIVLVNQGSQQLRFYDHNGRFLQASGRAGEGPGEFRDAFHLWVLPGDTIWVGDYRPWRFQVFAPNGEWQRYVQPDPMYVNPPGVIAVINDGRSILANRSVGAAPIGGEFVTRELTVVVHDPGGELTDTIGTYDNGRWGHVTDDPNSMTVYPLFESFITFTSTGDRIIHGHTSGAQFAVRSATDLSRIEMIVRWNPGNRAITDADIATERERIAAPYVDMSPGDRRRFLEPLVTPIALLRMNSRHSAGWWEGATAECGCASIRGPRTQNRTNGSRSMQPGASYATLRSPHLTRSRSSAQTICS